MNMHNTCRKVCDYMDVQIQACNKLAKRKKKKPQPILDYGIYTKFRSNSSKHGCGRWQGRVIQTLKLRYPKQKNNFILQDQIDYRHLDF